MYYVATLDPHDDGSGRYDVTFADLPGCVTQGTDLEDALRMAQEAVSLHVAGMIADGEMLPDPSTLAACKTHEEQEAREEGYALSEGTLWQYVSFEPAVKAVKAASVRLTISLRPSVIAHIDAVAEELGLSRSGVIAVATREYGERLRSASQR